MRTASRRRTSGARPRWGLVLTWVFLLVALGLATWSVVIGALTPNTAAAELREASDVVEDTVGLVEGEDARLAAVHRALGLIEYVIGDYPDAVGGDGEILDSTEYEEQRAILAEVRDILAPDSKRAVSMLRDATTVRQPSDLMLLRNMASAQRLVSRHAPSPDVQDALRTLWRDVVEVYDLRLVPPELPSLERGAALFAQACAACHGADGRGETEVARRLEPPPADLLDARFHETLSPARVFNAVTFGIPSTAMPAFVTFDETERWDLAFYVLALRQTEPTGDILCVATSAATADDTMRPAVDELAGLSDAALTHWLLEAGVSDECVNLLRVQLRRELEP